MLTLGHNLKKPSEWREMICPLLSQVNKDGSVVLTNCIADRCALWDWWSRPWPDVPAYWDDRPEVMDRARQGLGACTLPDACDRKAGAAA